MSLSISKIFFEKELTFQNPHKKKTAKTEPLYYCAFDPINKSIVAVPVDRDLGSLQTSLETLSPLLNQILAAPGRDILSAPQKGFSTFVRNIETLRAKIDQHNERIDRSWWMSLAHRILNWVSRGAIDWKIIPVNSPAFERIKTVWQNTRQNWQQAYRCARAQHRIRNYLQAAAVQCVRMRFQEAKKRAASHTIHLKFLQFLNLERYVCAVGAIPVPFTTREQILRKYEIVKGIGGGGEGVVYKVRDKRTRAYKALKYSHSASEYRAHDQQLVTAAITDIFERGLSPHLTRIHETFTVARGTVLDYCKTWYPEYPCKGWVMELLDGDFEDLYCRNKEYFKGSQADTYIIQIAFIETLLWNQYGIEVQDGDGFVYRNIFYKHLTDQDTFRGKKLLNYSHWKYSMQGHVFYLPRPRILIKLGDYDQWPCDMTSEKLRQERQSSGIKLKGELFDADTDLETLQRKYSAPPPHATILDMGTV